MLQGIYFKFASSAVILYCICENSALFVSTSTAVRVTLRSHATLQRASLSPLYQRAAAWQCSRANCPRRCDMRACIAKVGRLPPRIRPPQRQSASRDRAARHRRPRLPLPLAHPAPSAAPVIPNYLIRRTRLSQPLPPRRRRSRGLAIAPPFRSSARSAPPPAVHHRPRPLPPRHQM